MDVHGLDIVLTSLAGDYQELDGEADAGLAAARATETRLDDLEARIEDLRELVSIGHPRSMAPLEPIQRVNSPKPFVIHREWEDIRRGAELRLVERGVDLAEVSLDALLDPEVSRRIEHRFRVGFSLDTHLDGYDIAAAAVAGLVAGLVDFLIVRIPKDVVYLGEYAQKGSPLTKWLQSLEVPNDNWLARHFKVSYDKVAEVSGEIEGMGGRITINSKLGKLPVK